MKKCNRVSPDGKGACEREKGHKGVHCCITASDLLTGLQYEQQWTDGFKTGPSAVYMAKDAQVLTTH